MCSQAPISFGAAPPREPRLLPKSAVAQQQGDHNAAAHNTEELASAHFAKRGILEKLVALRFDKRFNGGVIAHLAPPFIRLAASSTAATMRT